MTTPSRQPDELDDTLHLSDVRDNNRTVMHRVFHYRHRDIKRLLNRFRSQNICGHSKSSDVSRLHHHQQHRGRPAADGRAARRADPADGGTRVGGFVRNAGDFTVDAGIGLIGCITSPGSNSRPLVLSPLVQSVVRSDHLSRQSRPIGLWAGTDGTSYFKNDEVIKVTTKNRFRLPLLLIAVFAFIAATTIAAAQSP